MINKPLNLHRSEVYLLYEGIVLMQNSHSDVDNSL